MKTLFNQQKNNTMLKDNPKYEKMFSAVEAKNTDQLTEAFTLLELMPISSERSLSMAVIFEVLESRGVILC